MDNFQILKRLYNNFDPFRALPAGDPTYVDCQEVRGIAIFWKSWDNLYCFRKG